MHKFQIVKNSNGQYTAKFMYNSEVIFWTEQYASKVSAQNAIDSIIKNGPNAKIEEI